MAGAAEHIPVLYEEVMNGLRVRPGGRYIDATVGAGGHARGILQLSAPDGQLLGLDADEEAITFCRHALRPYGDRVTFRTSNFRYLKQSSIALGFQQVDGVLMDLGLSGRQLSDAGRGFSFKLDGPLDMRMDRSQGRNASDLVNNLPEAELADLLWRYGEERHARRIARAIVHDRPIGSTFHLAGLVARVVRRGEKGGKRGLERIDPATRTFQALRIAVNEELASLAEALPQARDLLGPGGHLAVISFHSLEDRLVKEFVQRETRDCICPPELPVCVCGHRATLQAVTRKPLRPTEEEIARNPKSRSARLRIAARLTEGEA